ncbi:hypothetical protein RND71_039619 [Anisodus tanguticus]|uniref:Uncharacterized protein n=1 Tax=Anisodus tanguticus TaxID=243964 RepID=A0AAE1QXQ7_9SOLA|nr:hypothetical protein RND71_039619 [Anisodus tanguticus]
MITPEEVDSIIVRKAYKNLWNSDNQKARIDLECYEITRGVLKSVIIWFWVKNEVPITKPAFKSDKISPSLYFDGDEQKEDAAYDDYPAENPTGDVQNSSYEEEVVNVSDSERFDDHGSDVHEELRMAGVDEGYEDTDRARTNLRDKLGGDDEEPYCDSSDIDNFSTEFESEVVSDDDEVNASQQSLTGSTRKSSVLDTQQASTSMRGSKSKYKRPKVIGQGVFVSKSGYKCVNQGVTSSRLVSTPGMMNSALIIGDIGYKPSKGLK